jgi:hypothetical protein
MTRADDRELRILAGARAALGPAVGDQARVHAATLRAIAAGAAVEVPESPESALGEATRRVVARSAGAAAIIALAAGAAGVGYRLGFDAALREAPVRHAVVSESVRAPAPPAPAPETANPPSVGVDAPQRTPAAPPERRAKTPPPDTLGEEVRVLREVDRALREGRPLAALELLDGLDRAVPKGRLQEERAAARVLARCDTLSRADAQALGVRFSMQHPGSVYEPRVLRGCGAAPPAAPEATQPRTDRAGTGD